MSFDWRFFFTLILAVVAGTSASLSMLRLYRLMRLGKNEKLFDQLAVRIGLVFKNVLGHGKLFKQIGPGLQHFIIFWGFLIVTIGTTEEILDGLLSPWGGFSFAFLGSIYKGIVFCQDIFHPLILAAVLFGMYYRMIKPRKRYGSDKSHRNDAMLVLTLTGTLMFANIVTFAGYVLAGHEHAFGDMRPVSTPLAQWLASLGVTPEQGLSLAHLGWAAHLATVFFFMHYIPRSKHLHVIAAGPNIFLARLGHPGTFSQVNFADETQTSYGAGKITQFTWKDILDLYSCTQCGRCNEYCPTATTDKPLRPMELIEDLKDHLWEVGDALIKDKTAEPAVSLIGEKGISHETVWACTTCRACVEACPVMIEHVDKIVDMRRHLVMMEGAMAPELQNTMKNWEQQSNPWGISPDTRDEWAKDMDIPRLADKPDAEYLFYVGCAGSFNDRNKKITQSFARILKKAGVSFAILGKEELCNGETARRAGNEYLAKMMIDANIEVLKRYNVKKVITTCPHCFNTIKNEYPDFGFQAAEVLHHTELIDSLLKSGRIKPQQKGGSDARMRVAFHDSCYLGRYNEVYEAPRNALKAVPGIELVEMPRNRDKGLCCGAGGARMWLEETIGKRINVERTEEALATQPDMIAAGCPYCQVMVEDGVKHHHAEGKTQVADIAEIIDKSL